MRFPTVFRRRVGDAPEGAPDLPALGSDKPPSGKPVAKADNFHTSRLVNFNGFPSQRVVVGLMGPEEALGRTVPLTMWLHEDAVDGWLRLPGDMKIEVGGIAYFDSPCLIDHGRGRSDDDSHNPGTLDVVLVPGELSGQPIDGDYAFVIGTDVSNPGC